MFCFVYFSCGCKIILVVLCVYGIDAYMKERRGLKSLVCCLRCGSRLLSMLISDGRKVLYYCFAAQLTVRASAHLPYVVRSDGLIQLQDFPYIAKPDRES